MSSTKWPHSTNGVCFEDRIYSLDVKLNNESWSLFVWNSEEEELS